MITFLFLLPFLVFEPERLDRLRFIRFCLIRSANEPPFCFLTVFEIVFFSAFLEIFLRTTSINSGTLCNRISFPTRFAAGKINFLAKVEQLFRYHLLKLQSRYLFAYSVPKNEAMQMLDWCSMNPLLLLAQFFEL